MHDRAGRIDEIVSLLANSARGKSDAFDLDQMALDAVVVDLLFEKLYVMRGQKNDCRDDGIESRSYNELLMSLADTTVSIQAFEQKYGVNLLTGRI